MYVFISTLSQKFVDYLFFYDIGVFIEGLEWASEPEIFHLFLSTPVSLVDEV